MARPKRRPSAVDSILRQLEALSPKDQEDFLNRSGLTEVHRQFGLLWELVQAYGLKELASRLRRKRPAEEKHRVWAEWARDGLSQAGIARRWERETGEPTTRDKVARALQRKRRPRRGGNKK